MDERIFVKPKSKKIPIRFPGMPSRILKDEGEWVVDTIAWQRLIRSKDVVWEKDKKEAPKQAQKEVKKDEVKS